VRVDLTGEELMTLYQKGDEAAFYARYAKNI